MPCIYCTCYAYSPRRLGTEADGSKAKNSAGRRLCETNKAWKSPDDEVCDNFQPVNSFWCDRLRQNVGVDACRMKKKNGSTKVCKRCSQGNEIVDVIRLRNRKPKTTITEGEKKDKPALYRRKK